MDIELENTAGIGSAQIVAVMCRLRQVGVDLNNVESIWFQMDRDFVELEMHDGARRTIECADLEVIESY